MSLGKSMHARKADSFNTISFSFSFSFSFLSIQSTLGSMAVKINV